MVVIVLAMVIALGFANTAAAAITKINVTQGSWKKVPELKSAHSYLTWLSVAGWILIALVIVGIVLFFIYGGEVVGAASEASSFEQLAAKGAKKKKGSFMIDAVLFLAAGITITIGILSAIAARNLRKAQSDAANGIDPTDPAYSKAYSDTIIAASLGIGTIGLIVLVFIIHAYAKHAAKTSQLKKQEAIKEKKIQEKEAKEEELKEKQEQLKEEKEEREAERKAEADERAQERQIELEEKKEELAQRKAELESQKNLESQHRSNLSSLAEPGHAG